jgi:hypothetical protein
VQVTGDILQTSSSDSFNFTVRFPMSTFSTELTVMFVEALFVVKSTTFQTIESSADFVCSSTSLCFSIPWLAGSSSLLLNSVSMKYGFSEVKKLLIVSEQDVLTSSHLIPD